MIKIMDSDFMDKETWDRFVKWSVRLPEKRKVNWREMLMFLRGLWHAHSAMETRIAELEAELKARDGKASRETLAVLAHDIWSGWMQYMFSRGTYNPDGSWTMPAESVKRWQRQMTTPYEQLPEDEKHSDREIADRMVAVFEVDHDHAGETV